MKFIQLLRRALGKRAVVAVMALELDDKREPCTLVKGKHFTKLRDRLRRTGEVERGEVGGGTVLDHAVVTRHALEVAVVKDGKRAVAQQMHIQLRAVAAAHGAAEGREGVLGRAVDEVMQPAVGIAPMLQHGPKRVIGAAVEKKQPDREDKKRKKNN